MLIETQRTSVSATKSTDSFLVRSNYYVIPSGGAYHYFTVRIKPERDKPIFHFEKTPPVLREGLVVIDRKVYAVTLDDLHRGIVRKSRIVSVKKLRNQDGTYSTTLTSGDSASDNQPKSAVPKPDVQSAIGDSAWLEVVSSANAAWEEQVGALRDTLSEEEGGEWEIADATQSLGFDESGAVPDLDPLVGTD